jgi:hypothetical protein
MGDLKDVESLIEDRQDNESHIDFYANYYWFAQRTIDWTDGIREQWRNKYNAGSGSRDMQYWTTVVMPGVARIVCTDTDTDKGRSILDCFYPTTFHNLNEFIMEEVGNSGDWQDYVQLREAFCTAILKYGKASLEYVQWALETRDGWYDWDDADYDEDEFTTHFTHLL